MIHAYLERHTLLKPAFTLARVTHVYICVQLISGCFFPSFSKIIRIPPAHNLQFIYIDRWTMTINVFLVNLWSGVRGLVTALHPKQPEMGNTIKRICKELRIERDDANLFSIGEEVTLMRYKQYIGISGYNHRIRKMSLWDFDMCILTDFYVFGLGCENPRRRLNIISKQLWRMRCAAASVCAIYMYYYITVLFSMIEKWKRFRSTQRYNMRIYESFSTLSKIYVYLSDEGRYIYIYIYIDKYGNIYIYR